MRNTLVLLACLLLTSPAYSGMAVSDSVSHMYLSKELEETVRQLETAMEQLEFVRQSTDTLKKTYEEATAHYNRGKGMVDEIMRVKSFYDSTRRSLMGRYRQVQKIYNLAGKSGKSIEEFKDLLEDSFKDPRNADPREWRKVLDKQFDIRQLALKDLIEGGEDSIKEMEKRIERTEELSSQIDQTINPKDAYDLNNRILVEILFTLQEQLALSVRYQQTMASLKYEGVTKESVKARQEALKRAKSKSSSHVRYGEQVLSNVGISEDDSLLEMIQKGMNYKQ